MIEGTINVVLSVVLVNVIGMTGVIIATIITNLLINDIIEPYVVFEYALRRKPTKYYIMNYSYIMLFIVALFVIEKVCVVSSSIITEFLTNGGLAVVISVIPCTIMILTNKEFRTILGAYVKKWIRR